MKSNALANSISNSVGKTGKTRRRLLRGRLYDRNPAQPLCGGSIPTRFQRILMPQNTPLIHPNNRLDSKHFYKVLYNKEPGPGSYTLSTESLETNPSLSKTGYGVGFASKNFKDMAEACYPRSTNLGPGDYNPEKPSTGSLATRVFAYTGRKGTEVDNILKLNIPFDEKNPLNYIKPISLNLYVKQTIPGPGEYNTEQNTTINNVSEVPFRSTLTRMPERKEEVPDAGEYFINDETQRKKRRQIKTASRKRKIKYEWLGEEAKLLNESFAEKMIIKRPDIISYGRLYSVQRQRNAKEKMSMIVESVKTEGNNTSATFAISDMDRFGCQMRPKRPFELKPGPADYDVTIKGSNKGPVLRAATTDKTRFRKHAPPGPAFYNPQKEPTKLSFHLNVNRKWL